MRGFVPTPAAIVDQMVEQLFARRPPGPEADVLDPGCADGVFIDGILRWCARSGKELPRITGVELHPGRAANARARFAGVPQVRVVTDDFLWGSLPRFDYIVGNPPYVPITGLDLEEKARFRSAFVTASGRFDLYVLFWERALGLLKPGGRLAFITPEKYLTVESARPLRRLLAARSVAEVRLLPEDSFPGLTTYPTITLVDADRHASRTHLVLRDGRERSVVFDAAGSSLAPAMYADGPLASGETVLGDICLRISCGVATGADALFVQPTAKLTGGLHDHARPTVSGRQLPPGGGPLAPVDSILMPYDGRGQLLPFDTLNGLGDYLQSHKRRLLQRTCARTKPWYAFHETPPLSELLRPKILFKDITEHPRFWVDAVGQLVPRHSVYYAVPYDSAHVEALAVYLNGLESSAWLMAHCQRVRKGFIRLQSTTLKQLPVPSSFRQSDGGSA